MRRFVELAGGTNARIVIIPTASGIPYAGDRYSTIFQHLGANQTDTLTINDRSDANNPELVNTLKNASGVFMTGGNQIKVAAMLGGSALADVLISAHARGIPIAGTSAGASVMSKIMVAGGQPGRIPKSHMGQMSAGLGLIENVIIDQHFRERDRVARLMTMVSYNPGLIGVGIDEDTAALFWPDNRLEVLGRGAVMIIDGSEMDSDVYAHRSSRPVTISNAIVHFIASGGHFDLELRRTIPVVSAQEQVADS